MSERASESLPKVTGGVLLSLSQSVKTRGGDYFYKCKYSNTGLQGILKNQGSIIPPKEHHNFPVNNTKEIEI